MHVLLLHGAIGSSDQFKLISNNLINYLNVHTLNFSGHGGNKINNQDFSIPLFANDVLKWMDHNNISKINIFGYSMGGYVGLYLARHFPNWINKIFTLATKFDWTTESSLKEGKMLDAEKISIKLPDFAKALEHRHSPEDWKKVLSKTQLMIESFGHNVPLSDNDLKSIDHNIILSVGDNDKMVSIEETKRVSSLLRNSKWLLFDNTKHPIEEISTDLLSLELINFYSE